MTSVKRLYRSSDNRVFAGICGGLGEYFDVDPTVVRVVYVLLSLLTAFMGILLYIILLFVVCILGYLWYNATPSRLMMGDAGSRAMGIFISLAVLKTGSPFLFLLVALILILDGGLGLVKVALLRFLKIHIFANTTMPLHDHVRKKIGWSNTQTVFRFAIIQIVISIATVYMILI